jgi:hypothetical protein
MRRSLIALAALACCTAPALSAEIATRTVTNAAHYGQRGNVNNTNLDFSPGASFGIYRYITVNGTLTGVHPEAWASALRVQPSGGGLATGPGTPKGQSYFRFSDVQNFTGTINVSATILAPGGIASGLSTHFEMYSVDFESFVPGLDGRSTLTYRFFDTIAGAGEFSGAITAADPKHHRMANFNADPNGFRVLDLANPSANAVGYDVVPFYVGTSGKYAMGVAGSYDTYLALYHDSFNPTNSLTNGQHANNDGYNVLRRSTLGSLDVDNDTNGVSRFDDNLVAGTQYYLVVSTYENGETGSYLGQILGPGAVTMGVVPEPMSAMLLLGATMLRRRRR